MKRSIILLIITTITSGVAQAHLKEDPGVECFRMINDQVEEIPNTLSQDPFAEIINAEAAPAWLTSFAMGERLNVRVQYRVVMCRPFNVFVEPVVVYDDRLVSFTSPSPVYDPGEYEGEHMAFIGFKPVDNNNPVDQFAIQGVRVTVAEYGTGKPIAEQEFLLDAAWHARPTLMEPTERCADNMHWPPPETPSRACTNAAAFTLSTGFEVKDKVDINTDGICELLVEVESCRKLNNNVCHKVFEEANGSYREIWQYYNRLSFYHSENGYHRLGSTETGPRQAVHRLGTYDPAQRRYVTDRVLTPCDNTSRN